MPCLLYMLHTYRILTTLSWKSRKISNVKYKREIADGFKDLILWLGYIAALAFTEPKYRKKLAF